MSLAYLIDRYPVLASGRIEEHEITSTLAEERWTGVLFIVAVWSGPAVAALSQFVTALQDDENALTLPVRVCDTDMLSDAVRAELGVQLGGWGETFWILAGRIVGMLPRYDRGDWEATLRRNNRALHLASSTQSE